MSRRVGPRPPRAAAHAMVVTGLAVGAGAIVPIVPPRARFAANAAVVAGLIAAARHAGVDGAALGLDRAHARRGVALGVLAGSVAAVAVGVAVVLPRTRSLFADARVTGAGGRRALAEVLVRIPVETALAEELVFRGAVLGAWQGAVSPRAAIVASSVAFGAWHVVPALESHAHNLAGARVSARVGGRPAHVLATLVGTAVAGAVLAGLRLRARSIVAPVVAHAATNQLAYLAARWAHAR